MTYSVHTITFPSAHQPPGNQKQLPKATSDTVLFCSPFFFSCGHEQWWKTRPQQHVADWM